jgi:hypothetical protein
MSAKAEILLEGSYLYYQNDVNYSQENFKLVQLSDQPQFHIYAEILSRIETGEFLKLLIRYEMNQHFYPVFARIEKSIGNKYVEETYKVDTQQQELLYTFQTSKGSREFKKTHSSKHYISCPAFSASTMFTHTRKFDATGRTPVFLVSAKNDWDYQHPPIDHMIFAEFKNRELEDFRVNNASLSASHLCLYEHDSSFTGQETPTDIFVSKHYAVPYQLVNGEHKIVIKNLKKNN